MSRRFCLTCKQQTHFTLDARIGHSRCDICGGQKAARDGNNFDKMALQIRELRERIDDLNTREAESKAIIKRQRDQISYLTSMWRGDLAKMKLASAAGKPIDWNEEERKAKALGMTLNRIAEKVKA